MFCVNCGTKIENHFNFCPNCGINIATGMQSPKKNEGFEIVAGKLIKYTGSDVNVVIPKEVIEIGGGALRELKLLKSVVIADSVTKIGYSAFSECKSLENIKIPDSVTEIESDAFEGCENLKEITIGNGVSVIGHGAFSGCNSLEDIKIPDSILKINVMSFRDSLMYFKHLERGICPVCKRKLSSFLGMYKCRHCDLKF